ncbi:SPOR domain-containing protein [Rhabdochromatium marinum]|uniref:SPOR domain-containing protein n=1 Tax=Rhabdochromatium marinum TaxID=48729 RepID=UPI0019090119|nr:SPOR domain-containing protein [Rhabdochromatium marinum]MBK1649604.1 hypothetical protein [Rhabdochromatium marinum]
MDEEAKRRLVGAAVLVALMVIFVPMLVDEQDDDSLGEPIVIPNPPAFDSRFDSSVEPGRDEFRPPVPQPRAPQSDAAVDLRPGAYQTDASSRAAPPSFPSEPPSRPVETRVEPRVEPKAANPSPPAASGPATVPPGVEAWVIQVASLSAPEAAERLRNNLRGKGYPAFIEQAKINGTDYYRVRVGPEVDRARAARIATDIGAVTGGTPLVQRYR